LSVAVGGVQVAIAIVSAVVKDTFVGQADKTGFVVSVAHGLITVTVKEHVLELLLPSVAVYTTFVKPIGKEALGLCVLISVGVVQLSVAVGTVQVATAVNAEVVREIFAGQVVNTGTSLSAVQLPVVSA
jgi:hypothetical protein